MLTPQEAYSAAIVRACEAHLTRVKAAHDARVLVVSKARNFEHASKNYRARSAAYARAKQAYDKAIRSSEAQRVRDEAIALTALRARRSHAGSRTAPRRRGRGMCDSFC